MCALFNVKFNMTTISGGGCMGYKRQKGSALVTVILVMAVLTILGGALLELSLSEVKLAVNQQYKNQAHYLGRSGVYAGLKMLEDKLSSGGYTDMGLLVSDLNAAAPSGSKIGVSGAGSFNLDFSSPESGMIKIKSIGYSNSMGNVTDTVSLLVNVKLPNMDNIKTNPVEWFQGNTVNGSRQQELAHFITPSVNFPGCLVNLDGNNKPIRYNQGGSDADSIFQASVIAFTSYGKGIPCFSQDSNSLSATFDAEIIFFGDSIESSKGQDVILQMSDTVLNRPDDGILQPADPKGVGFENYTRYSSFIKQYNPSETDAQLNSYWSSYGFNSGGTAYKYGIVCFMKNVQGITSDYYFFPSSNTNTVDSNGNKIVYGTSIMNSNNNSTTHILGYSNLIRIRQDDPIRNVLNQVFSYAGTCQPVKWDNK